MFLIELNIKYLLKMKKLKNKIKNNLKRKKTNLSIIILKIYNKSHLKQYFIFKININKKSLKKTLSFSNRRIFIFLALEL